MFLSQNTGGGQEGIQTTVTLLKKLLLACWARWLPHRPWGQPQPCSYLSQKVLVAADSMVEALDQQRLHLLHDESRAPVERDTDALRIWGGWVLGGACGLGSLSLCCRLLAGTQTGMP